MAEDRIADELEDGKYYLQKFRLYETRSNFYMVGRDKSRTLWRVLKIDRLEPSELNIREDSTTYTESECNELLKRIHEGNISTGGLKFVMSCYGIVGFVKFLGPYYMLLITQRKEIGTVCGHRVYAVTKSEMIALPNPTILSNMVVSKNENRYKKLLCTVDLTKDFFFSYSYHVMRSLQKNVCDSQTGQVAYETMFVWNEFLTRGIRNHLKNTLWTVALVYGFFKQAKLSVSGKDFSLTLIARRSRHYAGTRYLKRGVNEKGRVANDVETEQIVFEDNPGGIPTQISSVVQNRGSIPLFWSQETSRLNIKPDIVLQQKDKNYEATRLHFENLVKRYGNPIIILNLIKSREKKPRESILRQEFANAIDTINKDLSEENCLRFLHWDLNKHSRSKAVNVLTTLGKVAAYALNLTGLFYCQLTPVLLESALKWPVILKGDADELAYDNHRNDNNNDDAVNAENGSQGDNTANSDSSASGSENNEIYLVKPPKFQKGVLRTNCIDCLDRTNVAQYAYGLAALGHQLHALGFITLPKIDIKAHQIISKRGIHQQLGLGLGPIQKMAVSQNGKYLAMFTHDGRLLVVVTDFSRIIFEYTCETSLPPEQIAWCGLDSVLLYWDEMLLMVGPNGDPVQYMYDEPIILIPECDGVRILSNSTMEFLQRVPDSTVSIFQIGSTEPGALLYDALDHFDKHSAKADENLRSVRSKLPQAVEACIDAAGHEFDVSRQRTLLRAASYGRAFCSQFPRERFHEMCKTLRVLNAVRNHEIGIPLSIQQYKLLTSPVLVGRLTNANRHLVALRISEYLNLNTEVVIRHWACTKITTSSAIHDAALLEILLEKLKLCKDISYAAIAAHADKSGRRKLAAMLVDHEPRSFQQVPLLLSIEEEDSALVKAIESGDTDLVYLVLFHIWEKKPPIDFFGTINARPLARDLFITFARCFDRKALEDFFLSTGRPQDVAFLLLKESWEIERNPVAARGSALQGPRIRLIEDAQRLFSQTKEHSFETKAAEEHAKLLRLQLELEASTKQAIFVGSSISDTIRTCIVLGNHRAAMRVRSEFKVSEKRWYWLKAFALSTVRDWDALEKFSKEKKPPGGYKPFVEACIDSGEKTEALKYIPKLPDPGEKSQAFARIGMDKEAADAASQAKDSELFGRWKLTLAQNSGTASIFDTLRDRLSFQGVY